MKLSEMMACDETALRDFHRTLHELRTNAHRLGSLHRKYRSSVRRTGIERVAAQMANAERAARERGIDLAEATLAA